MPATFDSPAGRLCAACGRPVTRDSAGGWRCKPCRNRVERPAQQRAQQHREGKATRASARISTLRHKATSPEDFADPADLTEDELRDLVAADGPDAIDFGDGPGNYALMVRVGAFPLSADDLLEADRLWATGEARRVLKRAGVSGPAFGAMIGTSGRQVYYWLSGKNLPKQSKHREAAAAGILCEKAGVDHDDSILVAHGVDVGGPPADVRKADAQLEADHAEIWESTEPWKHCTGCKRWRQTHQRRYD